MNFPKELALLPQWVCWHLEPDPKGGKDRKVPYNPITGQHASSTNPTTWVGLETAMEAQQKYHYRGLDLSLLQMMESLAWISTIALKTGN